MPARNYVFNDEARVHIVRGLIEMGDIYSRRSLAWPEESALRAHWEQQVQDVHALVLQIDPTWTRAGVEGRAIH